MTISIKSMLPITPSLSALAHSSSGNNHAGLDSMPVALADLLAGSLGSIWRWIAPILGIFDAFLSGSATFSNRMFSGLQYSVANHAIMLARQGMEPNAGNMICVMNVVTASAVVGMAGNDAAVIRKTMPVALAYALTATTLAFVWGGF